ncbi:MAG: DUF3857 domain-containing protein [Acidobacteriota bacterium]
MIPFRRALALSLLLCGSAFAAEPWEGPPFASDPKAALAAAEAIKPTKPEAAALVLLEETTVTFDAQGRSTRVERLLFRVLDESAVGGWGTIEAAWSPWYHERPEVDARVITREGVVHRLDPRSFQAADASETPDMFSDTRVLRGPMPAVAPGSLVEQTITYREKNPLYAAGVTARHQFTRWAETKQSRLILQWPTAVTLRFVNRTSPAVEPRRTEENGVTRLVFETGPMPSFEWKEWNLPVEVSAFSYVAWSTGQSWQEVARRYSEIIDAKIGNMASVEKITRAAVGKVKEPREIAARLLAAVERDIRYAGVEFGEGSIIPRTPEETLANKYGDCKDKATLLVAMLRKAGVPAHTALLRSGQGYDVEPDLPGLGYFDHVIVVTDGPDPIWIDPTDEFARVAELPDSDQSRLALIAHPDTVSLTRTPVMTSAANRAVETRQFKLAEEGKADIVEISEYFGSEERSMRRYYTSADRKTLGERLERYAKDAYLAKKLVKWDAVEPHDLAKPFRLRLEMSEATRGSTGNGESAVGIFLSRMVAGMPDELRSPETEPDRKPRQNDYVFSNPHVLELHYRVEPPPGYVVRQLPENETVKLGTATLTKHYAQQPDGVVLADYTFDSGPQRITGAQYEELRTEIPKVAGESALLLYFDLVARKHLDAGEVGQAVTELRRLSALHPKESLHHSQLAGALALAGMGEAARREAKRGVEIEPGSAKAHATLATMLTKDLIGREFRTGFDLEGALTSFRKAKQLASDDLSTRSDLAIVLQYDAEGQRYGKGAHLDEAIAEYVAMKKDIESADDDVIDRELMTLYTQTGRWDDLKKLLAETKDVSMKGVYQIVAAGASGGSDAALKASSGIEPAKRRDFQSGAAGILATLRLYPPAAALLRDAAQGAPNAAALRAQAEMLGKAVRHEDRTSDPTKPRSVLDQVFLEMMSPDGEEKAERFGTDEVRSVFKEDGLRELRRSREPARRRAKQAFSRQLMTAPFLVDLALSVLEVQQEGDETVGYRLRGRGAGNEEEMVAYVVKENGEFRIAGDDDSPQELALRALRHAEKNELAIARQWLDWARDHVSGARGEDPLESEPFAAVWTRGQEATADQIRLASAVLLPDTKASSAIAIPILTSARGAADAGTQTAIDQALVRAYGLLEKWPELLETAGGLEKKYPTSASAFGAASLALAKLGRQAEVRTRALARLERIRDDHAALDVLATEAADRHQYAEALRYYEQILTRPQATAGDYNQQAWTSLFAAADLAKAAANAERGVALAPNSYAVLNTLAVVYAEEGKSSEARETLLKSLEEKGEDTLQAADWYVVGRIAENYGILDVATEAYKRIEKQDTPTSPWELAQKRLAGLKR